MPLPAAGTKAVMASILVDFSVHDDTQLYVDC